MKNFSQSRFFNQISIDFQEDGILYSSGNIISSKKVFIPYEEIIYDKTMRIFKTDKFNLWIAVFAFLTAVKSLFGVLRNPESIYKGLLPFSILFFVAFLIATLLSRRHLLYVQTVNSGLIEIYDKNNSETQDFLKLLKSEVESFLKSKFTVIDRDLPTEGQLQNLTWLKERKIIDQNEFEQLKGQLLGAKFEFKGFK